MLRLVRRWHDVSYAQSCRDRPRTQAGWRDQRQASLPGVACYAPTNARDVPGNHDCGVSAATDAHEPHDLRRPVLTLWAHGACPVARFAATPAKMDT